MAADDAMEALVGEPGCGQDRPHDQHARERDEDAEAKRCHQLLEWSGAAAIEVAPEMRTPRSACRAERQAEVLAAGVGTLRPVRSAL